VTSHCLDAFGEVRVRPVVDGGVEVRANRFFRKHHAGLVLEERHDFASRCQRRKSRTNLRRIEQLVIETVLARASQTAGDDVAVRRADHQAAGNLQQPPPRLAFEHAPQLVGASQQRHVGGVFEVGEPDDPRFSVARSLIVARLKLLEAEHAKAARRGVRQCGAAHAAEADDDRIEGSQTHVGCHRWPGFSSCFSPAARRR
jgi:hypothetical protein